MGAPPVAARRAVPTQSGPVRDAATPAVKAPDRVTRTPSAAPTRVATFGADFDRRLDAITETVARPGNSAEILFDGQASYDAREAMIRTARSTIHLQTYIFANDATGWRTAQLLAERARAGVKVRVIYDGMGTKSDAEAIFSFLRENGVEVRGLEKTMPWSRLNARWHEKNLIVDGVSAIQGGMNIGDAYSGSGGSWLERANARAAGWHDTDMRFRGPAVRDAQEDFLRNWATLGPAVSEDDRRVALPPIAALPNGAGVRVVQNRPYEHDTHDIEDTYALAIAEARTSITIESAYFVPTERIREALIAAARRGVHVRVMTNSAACSDLPLESYVGRYWYPELLAAGVEIREMNRMSHAKTAAFDSTYVIVGSANLNHRAMRHDSETVVGVRDAALACSLERHYDSLAPESSAVTQQTLDAAPWYAKLWSWFLHFFVYFM